ncbi:unnamed protein product [Oncorhynchus mykiss]|uniref:Mannosyltransferase n=1 Tax=Oncorhynchus mykiss TaxID=8022 RepID=A0A060YB98_ONCMY|nr:unnamed protein product [Oncorhynchus mykiss]
MTACLLFMIDLYCVLYHNIDLTLCGVLALCIMCLGTEPWPFYFINGFLNFNVVFVLALLSLPLTALMEALLQRFNVQNLGKPYWLTLSPMYLWMLVFFTRPHKEERFLFPIYPLICLAGAVALSSLQKCYHFLFQRYRLEHYTVSSNWLAVGTLILFTLLSLSRSVALFRGPDTHHRHTHTYTHTYIHTYIHTVEVGSLHTLRLESLKLVFQPLHKCLVNKL